MIRRARYKFDGKCPDCGHEVEIEHEERDNYWKVRTFFVDCTNCAYSATGYENKEMRYRMMCGGYRVKPAGRWIWSETISKDAQLLRDFKFYADQITDRCQEVEGVLRSM